MHQEQPGRRKFRTLRHYDIPGHAHYLTFSCWRNQPFLSKDRARRWFLQAVAKARQRQQFDLWVYVIMLEHVHLFPLPAPDQEIAPIISSVKQSVAKIAVLWVRQNSPAFLARILDVQPPRRRRHRFWQPRGGYDRNIWTAVEAHEKIGYIHANPVRRGLVEDPADWPWSSCRGWDEGIDEPIPLDRKSLPPIER
jgi:putative transposase